MTEEVYVLEEGRIVLRGSSQDKEQIVRRLWRLHKDERAGTEKGIEIHDQCACGSPHRPAEI